MRYIIITWRSVATLSGKKQFPLLERMLRDYVWWGDIRSEWEEKGNEENKEKDKKFLYHKITLSSSDVIFYVPIYASGRREGGGRGTFSSCFEGGEAA